MPTDWSISKTQIDKAGSVLRDWWTHGPTEKISDDEVLQEASRVVHDYRESFQGPLKKVTVGVRQFVERESDRVIVGQRLKKMPAILNKLERLTTRLTQMEDIGGCRAILSGGAVEVQAVGARICRNWDVVIENDYACKPKSTGYRAVHFVVKRDERLIEVQLRTPGEQVWAEDVEDASSRLPYDVKHAEGPETLREYFRLMADLIAMREEGSTINEGLMARFEQHRKNVRKYFLLDR